ncbi:hypothetical protein [Variovorax sp. PCZ-1]|uniref:hypothetical protein n=1 Tax=Variovorax sp. PCZ-1 TaxID=2835533 RepID=UPI001BCFA6CC|nr:hypothetical protein [Variovorax sp. PCZ-1]MBS7806951.1 hypothetical protein [Variovorax sp. PCZ-1]
MSDSEKKPDQANNRWWESYLVRYFLGFIVGALCVVVLAWHFGLAKSWIELTKAASTGDKESLKLDWTAASFVVALLGLGYCYLASTPITVLHAGRYRRDGIGSFSRYFWLGWIVTLVFSICFAGVFSAFDLQSAILFFLFAICVAASLGLHLNRHDKEIFPPSTLEDSVDSRYFSKKTEKNKPDKVRPPSQVYQIAQTIVFALGIWSLVSFFYQILGGAKSPPVFFLLLFGAPILWIGLIQYVVLAQLWYDEPKVNQFYAYLFHARRQEGNRDVRETYTHLREHSNSIFIVLIELCWLALILGFSLLYEPPKIPTPGALDARILYVLFAIGIWVVPTVFLWSRANAMERFFSENPVVFLEKPTTSPAVERADSSDLNVQTDQK